MRSYALVLGFALALGFAGCSSSRGKIKSTKIPIPQQLVSIPAASSQPTRASAALPSYTPTRVSTPTRAELQTPFVTITSTLEAPAYSLISSINAARLIPATHLKFWPWELVLALAWSPDSRILAVAAGETIYLYSSDSFKLQYKLTVGAWTPAVMFSPDGAQLAAGSRDGMLRVWRMDTKELVLTVKAHPKGVNSIAFNPAGTMLASGGQDAVARLWELPSGEKRGEIIGGTYSVPVIAFIPTGDLLAIANGSIIRLREVETQKFYFTIRGKNAFYTLTLHPTAPILATGDTANGVQLWDLPTANRQANDTLDSRLTLGGHAGVSDRPEALVWDVAYSPQGELLASVGGDHTARIWNSETGEMLTTLADHSKAVTSVAFRPDGRSLATGSLDGSVIIWVVQP